ncbi:MAG: glycosyltransferase, partial [Sphingomonadaceae bacterium]|nr:glycosyltransferase [Sphingomonadaceae bacterium]
MTEKPPICIAVLAHNEEERIAACLNSLPLGDAQVAIHVIVNGSTDATAAIAGGVAAAARNVRAHIYSEGGKARSWNRFLFDDLKSFHETHI